MILLVADHCATRQIYERLRQSHNHWDSRLELFLVRFERESAVSEHDSSFVDVADRVHFFFDLELSDHLR